MNSIAKNLKQYITISIAFTLGVIAIIFQREQFLYLFATDIPLAILKLFLILITLFWLIRWLIFDFNEIDIFVKYLNKTQIKRSQSIQYFFPFLISIPFGILIGYGLNLSVYIPVLLFIYIVTFIGDSLAIRFLSKDLFNNKELEIEIGDEKTSMLSQCVLNARREIARYYFESNYFVRTLFAVILLIIPWLIIYNALFPDNQYNESVSYGFVILSIIVNETPLYILRKRRDKSIDSLEEEYSKIY